MITVPLSLKPVDIARAMNNGDGPTFRPTSRNKVVCNQLKHLGPLTRSKVRQIRNIVSANDRQHFDFPQPFVRGSIKLTVVSSPSLREARFNSMGDANCPNCQRFLVEIAGMRDAENKVTCRRCKQPFKLVVDPLHVASVRRAEVFNELGDADCPACGRSCWDIGMHNGKLKYGIVICPHCESNFELVKRK